MSEVTEVTSWYFPSLCLLVCKLLLMLLFFNIEDVVVSLLLLFELFCLLIPIELFGAMGDYVWFFLSYWELFRVVDDLIGERMEELADCWFWVIFCFGTTMFCWTGAVNIFEAVSLDGISFGGIYFFDELMVRLFDFVWLLLKTSGL